MEFVTWKAADPGVAGVESPPRSKKVKPGTKVGRFWPPGMGVFWKEKSPGNSRNITEFCGNTDQMLISIYDLYIVYIDYALALQFFVGIS